MARIKEHEVDWSPISDIIPIFHGRGYSHFSADEGARIRKFWMENQIPASWIARYYGIRNHITLYDIIHKRTTFNREALRLVTRKYALNLHQRFMAGERMAVLAEEVGCPPESLRRRFKSMKLKTRLDKEDPRPSELKSLLRQGMSVSQAAKAMGISAPTAYYVRRKIQQQIERTHQ